MTKCAGQASRPHVHIWLLLPSQLPGVAAQVATGQLHMVSQVSFDCTLLVHAQVFVTGSS